MAKGKFLGVVPPADPMFKEPWKVHPVALPKPSQSEATPPRQEATEPSTGGRIPVVVAKSETPKWLDKFFLAETPEEEDAILAKQRARVEAKKRRNKLAPKRKRPAGH